MGRKPVWPPRIDDHRGQARVQYRGKSYYLGPYGSKEVQVNYRNLILDLAAMNEKTIPTASGTVADALAYWLVEDGRRYQGTKEMGHFRQAISCILTVASDLPVSLFDVRCLDQAREEMIERKWNRRVIGRQITRVRTIWRWLERQGIAPRGSWEHLRTLGPLPMNDRRVAKPKPRTACPWKDLVKVCKVVRPVIRDLLLLGWFTGARPGELARLRAEQIDQTDPIWKCTLSNHKNAWRGQERVIHFGKVSRKILAPYLEKITKGFLFTPSHRCPERKRGYYSPESLAQVIRRASRKAGVSLTAYQMRHGAKERFTREMGLDAARAMLGQISIESTALYSRQADKKLADEVAKKLG